MTLTQAIRIYRIISKIFLTVFLVVVSFRVSTDVARFVFPPPVATPTPEPQAQAALGRLPPLKIKELDFSLPEAAGFRLDLVVATLPTEPKLAPVYPILPSPYGFLSLDRVRQVASRFLISTEPTPLSDHEYMFTAANENLRVDDRHFNFAYNYNYQADPSFFTPDNFVSREAGLRAAESIIEGLKLRGGGGLFEGNQGKDLTGGRRQATFSVLTGGQIEATDKVSQATSLRVDFFRADLGGLPVVEPEVNRAQTYLFIGGATDPRTRGPKVLELIYRYWVLDKEKASTYPLITSGQAWELLQKSPSYIVSLVPEGASAWRDPTPLSPRLLSAKEVFLAYYNNYTAQAFLQPVWVFTGKAMLGDGGLADWAAAIPAVHPSQIEDEGLPVDTIMTTE